MTLVADRTSADVLEIIVTVQDIYGSDERWPCALERALLRTGHSHPRVGCLGVVADGRYYEHTPESRHWVAAFDLDRSKVAPERFVLAVTNDPWL